MIRPGTLLGMLAALALALTWAAPATAQQSDARRVARLEADVVHGEDVNAIKELNRAYGYYVDGGLWDDVADLFADDAVANYPNGTWVGRDSIRAHLIQNLGGGRIGLGDGRLYIHTILQPVVHLDPGGLTARGRWRTLAMIGRFGGSAAWAEGVYEMGYVKQGRVWKIARLDYYSGFGAPYETGWGGPAPAAAPTGARFQLTHPPDRPRPDALGCPGYPAACLAPFDYQNPVSAPAPVWPAPDPAALPSPRADVADLARRAQSLADEQAIENLIGVYAYYEERGLWDEAADLFADEGSFEVAGHGVWVGRDHIRRFLAAVGPRGGQDGWLFDHLQMQPVIDLTPHLGYARVRELAMTGVYRRHGEWWAGVREDLFVKQRGVWKIRALRYYPDFVTDYDKGWGKDAGPAPGGPGSGKVAPAPDRPSAAWSPYPKAHIALLHFTNPVTGAVARYPPAFAPESTLTLPSGAGPPPPAAPSLDQAERLIAQVKARTEIENLEDAYGYYLDKGLWDEVADLFAADGSFEVGQCGVYLGQAHVRSFLKGSFGPAGPQPDQMYNHILTQPVIDIAPDGASARIRIRELQQFAGEDGPPGLGEAIHEDEAVLEGGTWKLKSLHAFQTLLADYQGGWAQAPRPQAPGPSATDPPDRPPTVIYAPFPKSFTVPFHYANPETDRP